MKVFPMYVGVILILKKLPELLKSVPHVCGGDPIVSKLWLYLAKCSPCMWGWSCISNYWTINRDSVPHVCGGDPVTVWSFWLEKLCSPCMWGWSYNFSTSYKNFASVPHVCGGDPEVSTPRINISRCSPCMWGWSWLALLSTLNWDVFPMYVGVIPSPTFTWSPILSVPHVCGGDPKFALCLITLHQCSPCMWGWS